MHDPTEMRNVCLDIMGEYGYHAIDTFGHTPAAYTVSAERNNVRIYLSQLDACLYASIHDPQAVQTSLLDLTYAVVVSGVIDQPFMLKRALDTIDDWIAKGAPADDLNTTSLNTPVDPEWVRALLARPFSIVVDPPIDTLWYTGSWPWCVLEHDNVVVQCVVSAGIPSDMRANEPLLHVRLLAHPGLDETVLDTLPFLCSLAWTVVQEDIGFTFATQVQHQLVESFLHPLSRDTYTAVFSQALVQANHTGSVMAFTHLTNVALFVGDDGVVFLPALAPWSTRFRQAVQPTSCGTWENLGALFFDLPASAHQRVQYLQFPLPMPEDYDVSPS